MNKVIILNLGFGNLQEGFGAVIARVSESNNPYPMQFTGSLPPAPEITNHYKQWQLLYSALYEQYSRVKLDTGEVKNVSAFGFDELCQELANAINNWLNSEQFRDIERQLRARLERAEEIQFVIETTDNLLRRLPWHLWDFFDDYPLVEVALSAPRYERAQKLAINRSGTKAKILAILGNSEGIDTVKDKIFIEQLSEQAEIKFLPEPQPEELNAQLWESGWDILFFAGHSSSEEKDSLQLNQQDSLKLDKLRYALKEAISGGLRLAIFNSCDGLGLAEALASLHIPQVIVMREPVPDLVAQEFLKHFLTAFSGGQSLYAAVRSARERLKRLEFQYPCASWLPVICQNLAEPPTSWQELCAPKRDSFPKAVAEPKSLPAPKWENFPSVAEPKSLPAPKWENFPSVAEPVSFLDLRRDSFSRTIAEPNTLADPPKQDFPLSTTEPKNRPAPKKKGRRVVTAVLASIAVAAGVMGVRHLGMLQRWELHAFDQLVRLRPAENPDPRILIVTISESDITAQDPTWRRGSISDWALNRLLSILEQHQPRVIGLDIYRDPTKRPDLIKRLSTDERLIAVCKVRDTSVGDAGTPPPPKVPLERQGFSDFVEDLDGVVRRNIFYLSPDPASPCRAPYSFNMQVAFRYLLGEGIVPKATPDGGLQLGNAVFKPLEARTGGYQQIDAGGYQLLINYRSPRSLQNIAAQVSLMQVLRGQFDPGSIKDRIVLIGTTAGSLQDFWLTPYSAGQQSALQLPGVLVQAQMVSQILSTAMDRRPLFWAWPIWGDILWVLGCSVAGGILALRIRSLLLLGVVILCLEVCLYGLSLILLLSIGFWLPLIPSALALLASSGIIAVYNTFQSKEKIVSS